MTKRAKKISKKTAKKTAKKSAKKTARKTARKTAKRTAKRTARKTVFRREDIPGINAALRDMADPHEVARTLGVPLSQLRARQIRDPSRGDMVNDFFIRDIFE
jgi:RNA polymerase primary sigma factor